MALTLSFDIQPIDDLASEVDVKSQTDGANDEAYNGNVTLTLSGGTAGAALGGTTTVEAADGLAPFSALTIDKNGTGYVLTAASDGTYAPVDSNPFDYTLNDEPTQFFTWPAWMPSDGGWRDNVARRDNNIFAERYD